MIKIIGTVLACMYAAVTMFAAFKSDKKNISFPLFIVGCILVLAFAVLNILSTNYVMLLIIGMLLISAAALANGIRQKNVHIHHHIIRFALEAIIALACIYG